MIRVVVSIVSGLEEETMGRAEDKKLGRTSEGANAPVLLTILILSYSNIQRHTPTTAYVWQRNNRHLVERRSTLGS